MLLAVSGTVWLADGSRVDLDGTSVTYSVSSVPSQPATWGRIKVEYR